MTSAAAGIGRMTSQCISNGNCGAAGFSPEEVAPRRFAPGSTTAALPVEAAATSSGFVLCDAAFLERARP
eukprot:10190848-Lingulodinium_polyedra.AAC.1